MRRKPLSALNRHVVLFAAALPVLYSTAQATQRYVSPFGAGVPPFTDWLSAATNIQDAIDASTDGDTVWVTNGVYSTGGRSMYLSLTNRVAINKAMTVQSVNGPAKTIIQGAWNPATTNGAGAIRCAWLTNGAVLSGFTLQGGATLNVNSDTFGSSGGGVWASSTNALVYNCAIIGNASYVSGGGAFSGQLQNCFVELNTTFCSGFSVGVAGPASPSFSTRSLPIIRRSHLARPMAEELTVEL